MIPDFPHDIGIRLAWLKFFLLRPGVANSLPCWLSQFSFSKLRQPTGQGQSNVRMQQKNQLGQSYSYIMRKVWYHQIWIQTYLDFIVFILMLILMQISFWFCTPRLKTPQPIVFIAVGPHSELVCTQYQEIVQFIQ